MLCVPAVFLGCFTALAVRFHSIEPLSGFLLLPFLGHSVFGAALLNLSLHSSNAEVSTVHAAAVAGAKVKGKGSCQSVAPCRCMGLTPPETDAMRE